MRSLAELTRTTEPAWPLVRAWVADATNPVMPLGVTGDEGAKALEQLQVTLRSPMGALVYHTGGLLIDGGWLRILGAGCSELPRALPAWSAARMALADGLLVADDAIGGFFALNGSGLPGERASVCHFAPDTLAWACLDLSYSDFLLWAFSGDLDAFYEGLRWPGWRDDCARLGGDQAFSFHPPLWAEGGSTAERSRRAVPVAELFGLQRDFAQQLGPPPAG